MRANVRFGSGHCGRLLDVVAHGVHGRRVDRYKLALSVLFLAVIPLFYVSIWLGLLATITIYGLLARFANKAFDHPSKKAIRPADRRPKH
jgi:hypothetical protein